MQSFWVVFSIFVVVLVGWAVATVRWAFRHDRRRRMSQDGGSLEG